MRLHRAYQRSTQPTHSSAAASAAVRGAGSPWRRGQAVGAVLVMIAALLGVSALPASAALADGAGAMAVTPLSVSAGTAGLKPVFTFTNNGNGGGNNFPSGSGVQITVPSPWPVPSTTATDPGYTTVSAGTCTPGPLSASGTVITVIQACATGTSFTLNYGAGTSGVTAPTSATAYTFLTASKATASGSYVPLASSPSINVTAGTASKLAFTTQPGGGTVGTAWAAQPAVAVQDTYGNTTTSTAPITLARASGSGNAVLTCTGGLTKAAVSGVAAFTGCALDKAGTGYALSATSSGLAAVTSNSFAITSAAASKLAFSTSPNGSTGGTVFPTQPVVTVQDAAGGTVASDASGVTLAITTGTGTPGAVLTCSANPTAAANGVAAFAGCKIDKAGTGYTLTATDGSLTFAVSASFTVTAAAASRLAFVQGPTDAFAGAAMATTVTVQVQDAFGNPTATSGVVVTLVPSTGVIDAGGSATTGSTGLATFSGVTINSTALGLTMTPSATGYAATAASTPFNITVKVTSSLNALTDTAADPNGTNGSGVASVGYYYCTGLTGSCTSATWTTIATSTTATGGFPASWTGQPTNGGYRVVVVATDNASNSSPVSASTPVTVAN